MGLLDFIFGKTPKIEHEFFGTMQFYQDKRNPIKSYYNGKRHFSPSDKTIEIGISGDVGGPTQEQIDFFKSIENNYPMITNSNAPLIEDEFGNWKEGFKINDFYSEFGNWKEGFKINDFYSEFEPVYLTL